jgi:hypothetical protein
MSLNEEIEVRFEIVAAKSKEVFVAGSMNGWKPSL